MIKRKFNRRVARSARCATIFCLLAWAHGAVAQLPDFDNFSPGLGGGLDDEEKVYVSAEFTTAAEDRPAMVFVTAEVAEGFHLSAVDQQKLPAGGGGPQATELKLVDNSKARLLAPFQSIQRPKIHVDDEAWIGLELREHEGEVTWYAPIEIEAGVNPAELTIEGVLEGQACNPQMCVPFKLSFTAEPGEGTPIPARSEVPEQPVAATPVASQPLWVVAGYGLLGGLILNLMPCVLPVIGLKLLSFAKQGGQSRAKILGLNVAYSVGLLSVFMVLATLAALVQLGLSDQNYGWGELNTYTQFKVTMTAVVFAMALSFLGVWELPIPGFASGGKATELAAQEGPIGAFCMGVVTTMLATPCSGPFLGPVLTYTIAQPPAVTYFLFASMGLGMALPYLLIGAFPSLVSWLPKPGHWMETLKHLMGFVLLATVVYLFSTINQDYFLATLALLFGIWFACWSINRAPHWAPLKARIRAWGVGMASAALIGWASFQFLTPSESPLPWQPYSPQALAVARAQGKTVLVDFTADWCLTCKSNLLWAINREEVKQLVERNDVVTLLADWTDKNDVIKQALLDLNSRSIPLLAIYPADPNREVLILPDLLTQRRVLEALVEAGPSLKQESASAEAPEAPEFGASSRTSMMR